MRRTANRRSELGTILCRSSRIASHQVGGPSLRSKGPKLTSLTGSETAVTWTLLEDHLQAGKVPPIALYHKILQSYAHKGWRQRAMLVLDQMEESGPPPDTHSYNIMMKEYFELGELGEIEALLARLVSRGVQLDEKSLETLFKVALQTNDRGLQSDLQETAANFQIRYTRAMYLANIELYADTLDFESAFAFINALAEEESMRPDTETCNILLGTYAEQGDLEGAQKVVALMDKFCLRANFETYECTMEGYLARGEHAQVTRIFEEMGEDLKYQTLRSHVLMMKSSFAQGKAEEAMQRFQDVQEGGLELDHFAFLSVLSGLCRAELLEQVEQVWRRFLQEEIDVTLDIVEVLLEAYLKKGMFSEVESLLEFAGACAVEFQPSTYDLLITACLKYGMYDQVMIYMSRLRELDPSFEPTKEFYDNVIQASKGTLTMWEIMKDLGVTNLPISAKKGEDLFVSEGKRMIRKYHKELASDRNQALEDEETASDEEKSEEEEEEEDSDDDLEVISKGDRPSARPQRQRKGGRVAASRRNK